jgi:hypothetical protein
MAVTGVEIMTGKKMPKKTATPMWEWPRTTKLGTD